MEIKQTNIFGGLDKIETEQKYGKIKTEIMYRPAEGDRNCKNCVFSYQKNWYRKCQYIGFSRSSSTDVSQNKVCNKHRYEEENLL